MTHWGRKWHLDAQVDCDLVTLRAISLNIIRFWDTLETFFPLKRIGTLYEGEQFVNLHIYKCDIMYNPLFHTHST